MDDSTLLPGAAQHRRRDAALTREVAIATAALAVTGAALSLAGAPRPLTLALAVAAAVTAAWLCHDVVRTARHVARATVQLRRAAEGLPPEATAHHIPPSELEAAADCVVSLLWRAVLLTERTREALVAGGASVFATSRQVCETAERMAGQAIDAAASAEQVSQAVVAVAAATEELSATIRQVATHAADAAYVAQGATAEAGVAGATVNELGDASARVGSALDLITTIAHQTRLLALNATIEAAHAAELGVGFAVVASEVKSLASEAARATDVVAGTVREIQTGSGDATRVIGSISQTIKRVSDNQTAIAAAVEQQSSVTQDMGNNASAAAQGSAAVAGNISNLALGFQISACIGSQSRTAGVQLVNAAHEAEAFLTGFQLPNEVRQHAAASPDAVTEAYQVDGITVIQDTVTGKGNNQLEYVGSSWSVSAAFEEEAVQGANLSVHATCVTGDYVVLRFTGTQVNIYGVNNDNHGMAEVSIDGSIPDLVDQYSPAREAGALFWSSPQLPFGQHTLTVRVAGRKRPESTYFWIDLDRFEVR